MCTTILSVLINPSSPNVHTKALHTDFRKFPYIHTIHIYMLYCFLPERTFQEGYFFEKDVPYSFFSNLVQLTAIYTTLKKLQQKDGVTVILLSPCMPVIQGVFLSSVKNSCHIAKMMNLTTRACLFF